MAVPTGQRARRRRPQSEPSSCTSSSCFLAFLQFLSSWLRRLRSSRYWASLMVFPYCRIVATRSGSIDATTATQLLINITRFSLPRDIGTPSRCTEMHRLSPHSTARASTERVESHDTALAQLSLSKQVHQPPRPSSLVRYLRSRE